MELIKANEFINQKIKELNLNTKVIAKELDINYNTIYRFLTGKVVYPKMEMVVKLMCYLGITSYEGAELLNLKLKTDVHLGDVFYSNSDNNNLSIIAKEKMKKMHMHSKDISDNLKIAPSYLSRVLPHLEDFNADIILKVCSILDISFAELQWAYGVGCYPDLQESNTSLLSPGSTNYLIEHDWTFKVFLQKIKYESNSNTIKFLKITYEKDMKMFVLMSAFCFEELGLLFKEYIEYSERPKGPGSIAFAKEGELELKDFIGKSSNGIVILSAGEYASKIEREDNVNKFPLLYVLLKNIENQELTN